MGTQDLHVLGESITTVLGATAKYASSFSPEARALLEKATKEASALQQQQDVSPSQSKIAAYLMQGAKTRDTKAAQQSLSTTLGQILSGSVPLPRSSKEELSSLKTQLAAWRSATVNEQPAQVFAALNDLYVAAVNHQKDVDTVEVTVDGIMQKVLLQLHGVDRLAQPALQPELDLLEDTVNSSGGQGTVGAVFSLALNALQRMHAGQLQTEVSEESDESHAEEGDAGVEEEDEDDPFFMPLPSAALKMADEKKFKMLAQPLGSTSESGEAKPMLQMGSPRVGSVPQHEDVPAPTLTADDFEPVPEAEVIRSSRAASVNRASINGSLTAPSPEPSGMLSTGGGADVGPGSKGNATPVVLSPASAGGRPQQETLPETVEEETQSPGKGKGGASQGDSGAASPRPGTPGSQAARNPGTEGATGERAADAPPPGDEQHKQFVSFLQGQNPQACMFHAQMRLSLEGCRKLANFLSSSSRVRALSLSHNFLGDDGMQIICEGLLKNTSVTTIDLPDNNISDAAVCMLAKAVVHNASLTQLQLASNNIGDQGATALAELIKANKSIKKLGLAHNNIGKAGCKSLTAAISANKSLQQLQLLPGNPVEEKDAKALAKALQHSKKFSIRSLLGGW